MQETALVSRERTRRMPIALLPGAQAALRQAIACLDNAGQALRRGRVERADEVLALLQAAASHLEHAWDQARFPIPDTPPHLRGAE